MTSFDLPFDIVFEILLRLPVRSLLCFKSVCRRWQFLIENPTFAHKHLTQSNLNSNHPFSAILSVEDYSCHEEFLFELYFVEDLDRHVFIDLPFLLTHYYQYFLLGICNGLVCVKRMIYRSDVVELYIFNPTTREARHIPPFKISRGKKDEEYFGFGFHSGSYFLTRIIYTSIPKGESVIKSESYCLTTNTWKEIRVVTAGLHCSSNTKLKRGNDQYREDNRWFYTKPIISHGVFYWNPEDDERDLSFNVTKALFDEISPPVDALKTLWHLRQFKEELALATYPDTRKFDLWVLIVSERTWTKKFRIEIERISVWRHPEWKWTSEITMVGCARTGELVLEDRCGDFIKLYLYNEKTKYIQCLPYPDSHSSDEVFLFTPSLVSVRRTEDVEAIPLTVK